MADTHIAQVRVSNQTGCKIDAIVVRHRFGDDPEEVLSWGNGVEDGAASEPKAVTYKTGFGAMTSFDWWTVTWIGNDAFCSSSSTWYNCVVDFLSQEATFVASLAGSALGHVLTNDDSAQSKMAQSGTALLVVCMGVVMGSMLGRQSKADYKEFMLKSEDARDGVTITICKDRIEFRANSGSAKASFKAATIPPDVKNEFKERLLA